MGAETFSAVSRTTAAAPEAAHTVTVLTAGGLSTGTIVSIAAGAIIGGIVVLEGAVVGTIVAVDYKKAQRLLMD